MSNSTFIEEERPKGFWQERYEEVQEKYDQLLKSKGAPDKIWISTDTLNGYYMSNHPLYGEEYIRKDALLEWAKELQSLIKDKSGASFKGAEVVINEVINKIESL